MKNRKLAVKALRYTTAISFSVVFLLSLLCSVINLSDIVRENLSFVVCVLAGMSFVVGVITIICNAFEGD